MLESEEYGYKVPEYPDKEVNTTKMFVEKIDLDYDKSYLPENMVYPVYWKVIKEVKGYGCKIIEAIEIGICKDIKHDE